MWPFLLLVARLCFFLYAESSFLRGRLFFARTALCWWCSSFLLWRGDRFFFHAGGSKVYCFSCWVCSFYADKSLFPCWGALRFPLHLLGGWGVFLLLAVYSFCTRTVSFCADGSGLMVFYAGGSNGYFFVLGASSCEGWWFLFCAAKSFFMLGRRGQVFLYADGFFHTSIRSVDRLPWQGKGVTCPLRNTNSVGMPPGLRAPVKEEGRETERERERSERRKGRVPELNDEFFSREI